jgi:GntR family transcriptional regulator
MEAPVPQHRDHPTPVYQRIAAELRTRISAGQYLRRLPAESALAAEFGVNRLTARRAVQVLATAGLVEVVPGRGAYVRGVA